MMRTINAIYGARRDAALDDDTARALYERETGKRSLRLMTTGEQLRVLKALRSTANRPRALSGPYARKLQALWIDAFNLGIVDNRTDEALLAFVCRQTGIERTEFLRDAAVARKAVEGLKKWIERAGGVAWGEHAAPIDDVIAAQVRILDLASVIYDDASPITQGYHAWLKGELSAEEKVAVSRLLGARIRKRGRAA